MTKICNTCSEDLPLESFHKNNARKDGHQNICKNCCLEYNRKRLNQTPRRVVKDGFKYCLKCKQELPLNKFSTRVSRYDFVNDSCEGCMKEYRTKIGVEGGRARYIRSTYGLSWEDYTNLFIKQQGKCGICNKDIFLAAGDVNQTAHVDHNHTNGKVRGLLCGNCNKGIGYLNDDVKVMQCAIDSTSEEV